MGRAVFVHACAPGNLIAIPNANPGPRRRREAHLVHGRSSRPPIGIQSKYIECLGAVADTTPGSGRPVTRGASEACWPNAGSGRGSGGVHPDQRPGCRRRYVECLECNGHVWPGATVCVGRATLVERITRFPLAPGIECARKLGARVSFVASAWRSFELGWPALAGVLLGFVRIWDQFLSSSSRFEVR